MLVLFASCYCDYTPVYEEAYDRSVRDRTAWSYSRRGDYIETTEQARVGYYHQLVIPGVVPSDLSMISTLMRGVLAAQLLSSVGASSFGLKRVLTASDGFGISIANDDTLAAVGAWLAGSTDMPNQGKVEIYDCSFVDDCPNVQTLTIPEDDVQDNDFFGSALSIDDGLLVVGVPGHNVNEDNEELTNAGMKEMLCSGLYDRNIKSKDMLLLFILHK